jgi:two-component system phosphate regulon sensor histidine kinase PhoR
MRFGHVVGGAVAIGAVPVAALAFLLLIGAARPGPILVAGGAVALAAVLLAVIWARDLGLLAETLRRAARASSTSLASAAAAPLLPPVERVARGIERLSRSLASRAAQVEELLHSNEVIVERLPDPLLVLDAERSLRRANAAARAAFGADMAAVLRHPGLREAIDTAFAERTPQTAELSLPVPIQREVQATVIYVDPPLPDGGQAIAVLSDRTRERAVERMRVDFVANASHELRTPLASLIGFIETLRGPAVDDPPAQRRFLAIMAMEAGRMNRLIDDLLSLSRIELTEHQPPAGQANLADLCESIAAAFEPRLAARNMTLEVAIEPALPKLIADGDQLAQVVTNLVDNALKYGRDGGNVRLALAAAQPSGKWPAPAGVVLTVADDGPGIPRADVQRLTERFYRVDKGRSRAAGGTGLGLAIVKHIVNRHRGQLLIESEEGRGSTFSVWLPLTVERA